MIDRPSILHDLALSDYLADPCPEPSLTSTLAREVVLHSPRHAWTSSPRLNPNFRAEEDDRFDLGRIAHAYILEGETRFEIVPAQDWRGKMAREARDNARAAGRIAILQDRWQDVMTMAAAVYLQSSAFEERPAPFTDGEAELTLCWTEPNGVWCRARLDYLHTDGTVDDLKTTSATANPDVWSRAMFGAGSDIQAALYLRGLKALTGVEGTFRFCIIENFSPFAMSVVALAPDALALAEKKVEYAIAVWGECLRTNVWPAYPKRTCYAEAPPWEVVKWEARAYRERVIDDGRPLDAQLFDDKE